MDMLWLINGDANIAGTLTIYHLHRVLKPVYSF